MSSSKQLRLCCRRLTAWLPARCVRFLRHRRWRWYWVVECCGFVFLALTRAAVAQLAARRSHNPKVVSSILTCRMPPARAGPAPLVLAVQARRRGLSRIVTASRSPLAVCQVGAGGPLQSPKQPGRTSSVDAWRRQWPVLPPCDRARVPQLARGGLQSGPACMAPSHGLWQTSRCCCRAHARALTGTDQVRQEEMGAPICSLRAAVAQLAARRSHNPKVVSSILTCRRPRRTSRAITGAVDSGS